MNDLVKYGKRNLAKQVVALKHKLFLMEENIQKIGTDFGRKENDSELRKKLHLFFRYFGKAIDDLFYIKLNTDIYQAIGKHFSVSSEQLEEIEGDLRRFGVLTEADYPTEPILEKGEYVNYYRFMRELCEDVEEELEEKMRKEGKE